MKGDMTESMVKVRVFDGRWRLDLGLRCPSCSRWSWFLAPQLVRRKGYVVRCRCAEEIEVWWSA